MHIYVPLCDGSVEVNIHGPESISHAKERNQIKWYHRLPSASKRGLKHETEASGSRALSQAGPGTPAHDKTIYTAVRYRTLIPGPERMHCTYTSSHFGIAWNYAHSFSGSSPV